jgi:hypothetical protein
MKLAVVHVGQCGECPFSYFDYEKDYHVCGNMDKSVVEDSIDEECPLKDS